MTNQTNRGGHREGAGRPATLDEPVRKTIVLEKRQVRWMTRKYGRNWIEVLRRLIDDHIAQPKGEGDE